MIRNTSELRTRGAARAAIGALVPGESLAELLLRLGSAPTGLTPEEARTRLTAHGEHARVTGNVGRKLVELARIAWNPLAAILLVASIASAALGQVADALIIVTIVGLSAALNARQTWKSERAVERLQSRVAPTATVVRAGATAEVPRGDLVPGDVVRLSAGDLVPADARLVESRDLHVQQAALTGESLPVEKDARPGALASLGPEDSSLVFLGTSIVSGTATAVVFATGAATAFGDVVARLSERPEETEFERGIRRFGLLILQVVVFLVLFILVVSVATGRNALESLLFAVALAVGLTPEFLPMITTVTLSEGAVRMAREKVIVKHLAAIQNLGSIDVLCSDKTGTLTVGAMSLSRVVDPAGAPADEPLRLAFLNSRFETGIKSPLDVTILAETVSGTEGYEKTDEVPFDFERRRLSVSVHKDGQTQMITKGAPEGILDRCTRVIAGGVVRKLDDAARTRATAVYLAMNEQGMRTLAVATKALATGAALGAADETELCLVGFLAFSDPPLPDAHEVLEKLREDGVTVKILSGDSELVCRHVCSAVGLDATRIVLGDEIEHMTDSALAHVAEQVTVFARMSPGQKNRVLHALKSRGHVVGYLGDGINDAPSLHAADVGISVAGAVDVARDASDIVLLESHLGVLHGGILAGRRSFANVLKYLLMGTSSNFGNMFSMAAASVFLPFLPMLPTQILLNNFLYDAAQLTIPTDNVDPAYLRRPQRWNIRVIRNFMLVIGPVSSLYDFLTFYVLLRVLHLGEAGFHTGWFVESLATQTLVLFVIRTAGPPWKNRPSVALTVTTIAIVLFAIVLPYTPLGAAVGLTPLPLAYFAFLTVAVASYLALVEVVKRLVVARIVAD